MHHIAMFVWRDDADPADVTRILEDIRDLPRSIPEIETYHVGEDLGEREGNSDAVVVASFRSVDDYGVYASDETHLGILRRLRELIENRSVLQTTDF